MASPVCIRYWTCISCRRSHDASAVQVTSLILTTLRPSIFTSQHMAHPSTAGLEHCNDNSKGSLNSLRCLTYIPHLRAWMTESPVVADMVVCWQTNLLHGNDNPPSASNGDGGRISFVILTQLESMSLTRLTANGDGGAIMALGTDAVAVYKYTS